MKLNRILMFIAILLGALAIYLDVTKEDQAELTEEDLLVETFYFESVARGFQSTLPDTLETVIRDQESWDRITSQMNFVVEPDSIDFDLMMAVLVSMEVESGGQMLAVETIERTPDSLRVVYTSFEPGGDCLNAESVTRPFHIIKTRKSMEPARFVRQVELENCAGAGKPRGGSIF